MSEIYIAGKYEIGRNEGAGIHVYTFELSVNDECLELVIGLNEIDLFPSGLLTS